MRSIKSYMAELEQYLNDAYRFYDDVDFKTTLVERLDLAIQFHDGFIDQTPRMFDDLPESRKAEMIELYRYHTLKSKRLFEELKAAIIQEDYDTVKKVLNQLDANRRKSHTIFG